MQGLGYEQRNQIGFHLFQRAGVVQKRLVEIALLLVGLTTIATIVPVTGATLPSRDSVIEPGLLQDLNLHPTDGFDVIVNVDGALLASDVAAIESLGARVVDIFPTFHAVYVLGTGTQVHNVANILRVAWIQPNSPLTLYGYTGTVATRAREAWDAKSTSTSPVTVGGNTVNGSGIGIAIVDSGIDATHPDLASAVAGNRKWSCATPLLGEATSGYQKCYGDYQLNRTVAGGYDNTCHDSAWKNLADTDLTSGHGTHVAGIAAGRGVVSDGRFMGSAPGASLQGLGSGEGISILWALEAFKWIDCWHSRVTPEIRIVSNSWGTNAAYTAGDAINVAVRQLVTNDSIVVLFAAGNDGGTGTADNVNTYARNPLAGVISVANYDDMGNGTPNGALWKFSTETGEQEWQHWGE